MNKKTREKYHYLHESKSQQEERVYKRIDMIIDGFGTSWYPKSTLMNYKYTTKNILMYYLTYHEEGSCSKWSRWWTV